MSIVDDFLTAVKANDVARVNALLEQDPELVNARIGENSAILTAIYHGARDVATVLAERGATLNLFEAAAVGDDAQVRRMLDAHPDAVCDYSHDGFTALMLAAFFGHYRIVHELLERGAPVNAVSRNAMRVMALHSAVARRDLEISRLLIEHGADVNAVQQGGFTPLLEAVHNGQLEMVQLLLAHGADPNQTKDDGESPLAMARSRNTPAIEELLRRYGATQ